MRAAAASYDDTIQIAFREVADALTIRDHIASQVDEQSALVDQLQHVYSISQIRFLGGIDDYTAVQDAQRTLFTAQRQLIELQLQANVNLVNLYKALGGGWSEQNIVASVPPRSALSR